MAYLVINNTLGDGRYAGNNPLPRFQLLRQVARHLQEVMWKGLDNEWGKGETSEISSLWGNGRGKQLTYHETQPRVC